MDLTEAKSWLRIEHTRDDALLSNLILPAAIAWVADQVAMTVAAAEALPPLRAAALAVAGTMYAHRESVITGTIISEVPGTVRAILDNYRFRAGVFNP